jgi:hypothetical protein
VPCTHTSSPLSACSSVHACCVDACAVCGSVGAARGTVHVVYCTACRHLLEGTNIVSITLAEGFLLCISKQCLVVHGVVPLSVLCAFIIAHYRMFVNRQNAQSLQKFFVQGLLLWQLGPRRTYAAQRVHCIIIIVVCVLYYHCVCIVYCTYIIVYV